MNSSAMLYSMPALEAVAGRRSVRRFLPDPVPDDYIQAILAAASRAPSGVNAQPWFVHVVRGAARARLSAAVITAARRNEVSLEYRYLPEVMPEPYLSRRRKVGHDLYSLYGIDRSAFDDRKNAMLRNFDFFGAPTGMFFALDRAMTLGSWIDMGMFIQNVMIVSRAYGLETCPQQAWCDYGEVVHRELGIPNDLVVLCGLAIGYMDPDAPENTLVSDRVAPEEYTTFHEE